MAAKKNNDLQYLYSNAMKGFLKTSQHKHFLTQDEFVENYAVIMLLSDAARNIEKQLTNAANLIEKK